MNGRIRRPKVKRMILFVVVCAIFLVACTGAGYLPDHSYMVRLTSGKWYVCKHFDFEKRIARDCDEGIKEIHLGVSDTVLIRGGE